MAGMDGLRETGRARRKLPLTLILCRVRQRRLVQLGSPEGERRAASREDQQKRLPVVGALWTADSGTRAAGPTIWRGRERNVPYYQTNPPFLVHFFSRRTFVQNGYDGNTPRFRWVRSRKTNPPEGAFEGYDACPEATLWRETRPFIGVQSYKMERCGVGRPAHNGEERKTNPNPGNPWSRSGVKCAA